MKLIKSVIFIFLLTFCGHAFAKSSEYYKATLVHVLSNCNSDCQKQVFEDEVHKAFFSLLEAILQQVKWQLKMKEKQLYD
jgi:hypothetical protein